MTPSLNTLLICTVGGSSDPINASLRKWQPKRVFFVPTPQTVTQVESEVLPKALQEGVDLDPGRYEVFVLEDGQDLAGCIDRLRELTPEVSKWVDRGEGFQVVVDFTGGTKCMSAAIAIQASRWPCLFSYVGGTERTKDGVGTVVTGKEQIVDNLNPWDALGHQTVDDFVTLFDRHAYRAAAALAAAKMKAVSREDRKREFNALSQLGFALDDWDRFNHSDAKSKLKDVTKAANDLRAILGAPRADSVLQWVKSLNHHLTLLTTEAPPSRSFVVDLLANAKRRRDEGRYDDAVARLYRAIEATAQVALKTEHNIESTENVALIALPEELRLSWASRAESGVLKLGLQDDYKLLAALQNPIGATFEKHGLGGDKSPLVARNRSILAHGFERVSEKVFESLWRAAGELAKTETSDLLSFPRLRHGSAKA